MVVAEGPKILTFNAFGDRYLTRFMFLSICRLCFIQFLREIDIEKVSQELFWAPIPFKRYRNTSGCGIDRLSRLCFYNCICCFVIRSTTPLFCCRNLSYEACYQTNPTLIWKLKKWRGFGKKSPDFVHPEVKFIIQNIVLRVSQDKNIQNFPLFNELL